MKYKIGDKVKIKPLEYFITHKSIFGSEGLGLGDMVIIQYISKYCGKEAVIIDIPKGFYNCYKLDIDQGTSYWTEDKLEQIFNDMEQKKITLPKGWEIDKVEGNEIILKESKNELPKTRFECLNKFKGDLEVINVRSEIAACEALAFLESDDKSLLPKGRGKSILALARLIVCRDVYRGGWTPDWEDNSVKYCIVRKNNEIITIGQLNSSSTLSFQSAEIRDKFLENFRDLIEEAKELI